MVPHPAVLALEETDIRDGVRETRLAVAAALRPTVAAIAVLDTVHPSHVGLPGPRVQILLRRGAGTDRFAAHVVGPRTVARRKPSAQHAALVARFSPGAARIFLGCPVSELTDAIVHLRDLWGDDAERLTCAVAAAPDLRSAAASLEAMLARRLAQAETGDTMRIVQRAVALLGDPGQSIAGLAIRLGISSRQLHRLFCDATGLSPKAYARALRLRRALSLARSARKDPWASIAVAAGYYDQPHMIDDFRALAGATPPMLLAELGGDGGTPS
jgi:AraC-like DNA-binding protein